MGATMTFEKDEAAARRLEELRDERATETDAEWLQLCLDEGSVLQGRIEANGETAFDEDRLDWLVPDRDGDGYVVVTGLRASDDMIGVVLFDD